MSDEEGTEAMQARIEGMVQRALERQHPEAIAATRGAARRGAATRGATPLGGGEFGIASPERDDEQPKALTVIIKLWADTERCLPG